MARATDLTFSPQNLCLPLSPFPPPPISEEGSLPPSLPSHIPSYPRFRSSLPSRLSPFPSFILGERGRGGEEEGIGEKGEGKTCFYLRLRAPSKRPFEPETKKEGPFLSFPRRDSKATFVRDVGGGARNCSPRLRGPLAAVSLEKGGAEEGGDVLSFHASKLRHWCDGWQTCRYSTLVYHHTHHKRGKEKKRESSTAHSTSNKSSSPPPLMYVR